MSSDYTSMHKVCAHIPHMSRLQMTCHQQKLNTWDRRITLENSFSEFGNLWLPCLSFIKIIHTLVCLS